ncbi:MAG: sugar ABC transporter permease [Acidobacteria bacterium]|nr:sugar ABC transporter permease [Acidobacteriota bacterium]MBV9478247.1 sugar ABC transporter permease [Acidobacteriota bacterium]
MKSERRAALLFLAPALVLLTVFFFAPVVAGFALSLTDFDLYTIGDPHNIRLVGFDNYRELIGSSIFWTSFVNTMYFALVGGPLTVAVSLAAALLINAKAARFKALFRTVYFAPVVTTLVAVSIVFKYIYHPRFGMLNRALDTLGLPQPDWLGNPKLAMLAIIILAVWKGFGYTMIIFVAGLQQIPEELYEAARLDGAGAWKQFRHVTLPLLAPTFLFVGIVVAIGQLQIFAEPYVMTRGGPLNKTVTMVMLMYEQGFKFWKMGYAAAVAFVLFLVIGAATLVQLKMQEKR